MIYYFLLFVVVRAVLTPRLCSRKQEDLVYNVRKRLEDALMADMLAQVEETSDTKSVKEETNGSGEMETV